MNPTKKAGLFLVGWAGGRRVLGAVGGVNSGEAAGGCESAGLHYCWTNSSASNSRRIMAG